MSADNELLDKLVNVAITFGIEDITRVKARFLQLLYDYTIEPKKAELILYEEGKNDKLIQMFILSKITSGKSERTCHKYDYDIRKFLRFIGKDADQVTAFDIQYYLATRMQQVTMVTVDNEKRSISSFYNFLTRDEFIQKNPMNKIDAIKKPKVERKAFSEMDIEKIRNACMNNRESAMIEFMLSTGCRVSEVCSVKISDIQQDHLSVVGKGNKQRTVYLNAKAIIAIQKYLNERKDSSDWLFPSGYKFTEYTPMRSYRENWYKHSDAVIDRPIDKSSFEATVRKIGKRASVPDTHPHRFRRTCATHALRHGMPIEIVSKLLGHSNLETTQIYLDISEKDLEQAHRKYVV